MQIMPRQPSAKGPAEMFTGDVWLDAIARGEEPSRVRVNAVRFSPGARTAWHSHALGQTLYVTEGVGRIQARGGELSEIRPGDVIYTPADEWHWHGAAPDRFMSHLSITEGVGDADRPEADWGAHVTDAEYGASEASAPAAGLTVGRPGRAPPVSVAVTGSIPSIVFVAGAAFRCLAV